MATGGWVSFIAGLVLLVLGGEFFVKGASRSGLALGMSRLAVGLVIVAFGTSAPEMSVSLLATLQGRDDLAVSNIVGSNIFNVLFILGLCASMRSLRVSIQLIRLEVPFMIAASALLLLMALDGKLSRLDGAVLLGVLVAYTSYTIVRSRNSASEAAEPGSVVRPNWVSIGAMAVGGLMALILGARMLVSGAVVIARALGLSETIIGLTIVSAGTSMPEVASSVIATIRGERDIAVGNVVGSNLFNILGILGVCALAGPNGVGVSASALSFDIPVMLTVAFACMPIFFSGHAISRWEGFLFFGYYVAYTTYLVLESQEHDALHAVSGILTAYILPLTLITLMIGYVRHFSRNEHRVGKHPRDGARDQAA